MRRISFHIGTLFVFVVYVDILYRLLPYATTSRGDDRNAPQNYHHQRQKVYIFPQDFRPDLAGELQHFIRNGIRSSPRLVETHDMHSGDTVWVVDLVRYKCDLLLDHLTNQTRNIYLIDFDDRKEETGFGDLQRCISSINDSFGDSNHVHYAVKVHVRGRHVRHGEHWRQEENKTFSNLGKSIPWRDEPLGRFVHGTVRVLRYGVRNDVVQHVKDNIGSSTCAVDMPRPGDIAHFWKVGDETRDYGHRSVVSEALLDLAKENTNLTVFATVTGQRKRIGRNQVQPEYVSALLRNKIVVVSQPDKWEDHYKLMEALSCGAMVMTDPMHPLPLHIHDGESVVVYHSIGDLKRKAMYYLQHKEERLQIATKGYQLAMQYHQSGPWMERIVFGDWYTMHGVP